MSLSQGIERVWPAASVHDTVAAVVRDPAFQHSVQRSLADVVLLWVMNVFDRLSRYIRHLPSARTVAITLIALAVVVVLARVGILARRRVDGRRHTSRRRAGSDADDPWLAAERFIVDGRYEDAAHAIYRGVLNGLAAQERIRLDPSKTSGDYARELRRRGSPAFATYRAFIRRFDIAVYGHGGCDAHALDELRALAAPFRARARAA